MDFGSLQICIYNRLLWINKEIRSARDENNTDKLKRFVKYRKDTDRLLSATKRAMIAEPTNADKYNKLQLLYQSQSLI